MRVFRSISVRRKVTFITVLCSMMALAAAAAVFVGNDLLLLRDSFREELSSLAQSVGNQIPVNVTVKEQKPVRKPFPGAQPKPNNGTVKMEGIRFGQNIVSVHLLDQDGRTLFQYQRDEKQPEFSSDTGKAEGITESILKAAAALFNSETERFDFHPWYVDFSREVHSNGKKIGNVLIRSDLDEFSVRMKRYGIAGGAASFAVLFFAFVASLTLRRTIAAPLAHLTQKMSRVCAGNDYSIRFYSDTKSEVGILGDSLNRVLGHVQNLNSEIEKHMAQLELYRDEYKKLIAAQTRKLTQSNESLRKEVFALRNAKEAAESEVLDRSLFLSKMGDEIRSPLNNVLGMVTMLLETELTEQQMQFAEAARSSGHALLKIIKNILSFSPIDSARLELDITESDLQGEIEQSVELMDEASPGGQNVEFHGNILVAENNAADRHVARNILEGFGCQIDFVDSGLEAVEAWSRNSYDLIFMECVMPDMDGRQATKFIRQMEILDNPGLKRGTPIIAMMANASVDSREQCLDAGMDDCLSKPFQKQDFLKVLEYWLLKKPTRDASCDPQAQQQSMTSS